MEIRPSETILATISTVKTPVAITSTCSSIWYRSECVSRAHDLKASSADERMMIAMIPFSNEIGVPSMRHATSDVAIARTGCSGVMHPRAESSVEALMAPPVVASSMSAGITFPAPAS